MTMSQTPATSTISSADLSASLTVIEVKPGVKFSLADLRDLLPDAETALFFAKMLHLDYVQTSNLLANVLQSNLADELFRGTHSTELQDFLVDGYDEDGNWYEAIIPPHDRGNVVFEPDVPHGEILPHVWESLQIEVAQSIQDVADKLQSTIGLMPGKQGQMLMRDMMRLNKARPTMGVTQAVIQHQPQKENLIIFDVSGSMSAGTVRAIVDDVVALSFMANAHFAIVSNTCTHWDPGTYDSPSILAKAEFGGTMYQQLKHLLDRDWGVVVTIADYDSSHGAREKLAKCKGRIDQVFDVSLVNRPTFLAECVGQLAAEVKPLLVAQGSLCASW